MKADIPKEFYKSTKDWASVNPAQMNNRIKILHSEEFLKHRKAKGLEEWFKEDQYHIAQPFTAVIPNGRYTQQRSQGAVITQDDKLLWDLSKGAQTTPKDHWIFQQNRLPECKYTPETVAAITFRVPANYYHWTFDIIPRFDLVLRSGVSIDKFIVNRLTNHYQHQMLKHLGIPKEKIIQSNDLCHIRAKKLVVPSLVGDIGYTKWACNFLRKKFLNDFKSTKENEYIYLSRRDVSTRNVTNEQEVMGVLSKYGFKSHVLLNLSVADQIRLFSSAKVIVAPHGAGLTNLVYCNPGTKIIELFSPNFMAPFYWWLSNNVGLDYYFLIGKGNRPPRFSMERADQFSDISIDLDQLRKTLELANL